jgi:hypothetical protein
MSGSVYSHLLGSAEKPVWFAIHSYVVEPIAIAPTVVKNLGY